jgi:hypothetical protein
MYLPERDGKLTSFVTVAETFEQAIQNFTDETGLNESQIWSIHKI